MALVLAGTAAAVAGCTGSTTATPTVAVTTTPTLPAPMPSPARPDQWADTGETGAQAAAVWFVRDLYSYVVETNDVTDWQALSEPDCEFCRSVVDDVAKGVQTGTVLRQGVTTVTVTRYEALNPLAYSVLVDFDQPPSAVMTSDGVQVGTTEASHGQVLLVIDRVGPDWHLRAGQWFESGAAVPTAGATS